MNLSRNLENAAIFFPERIALIDGDREVSYREFNEESNRIATGLMAEGVGPGDHIAICRANGYRWISFYFGILKAGAVAVCLSPLLKRHELVRILDSARPRILYASPEVMEEAGDLDLPYLGQVIAEGEEMSYETVREKGSSSFRAVEADRHDTCTILYTGGTTGSPKGVMLTHENIMTSAHNVAYCERSTPGDRAICFLPLSHVFGLVHITNAIVYSGGSLVIQPSFDLEKVIYAIKNHGITKFFGVPTIYVRLLSLDNLKEKISSLRYCFSAAASMAAGLVKEWKEWTGLDIHEAYGLTESASIVTYNHYYRHLVGSVGSPVNTVEVRIMDPDGNDVGQGEEGEICIRGPNIMKGYLGMAEETRTAFRGEWFRSGDIGLVDDNGYLFMVDRIKEIIITGGENVYPSEIEEILYSREEVEECAVIGLPDREYGERVTAFIIVREGYTLNPEELRKGLKEKLSPSKVPKEFISVPDLPRSGAGKILKRELKKMVLKKPD